MLQDLLPYLPALIGSMLMYLGLRVNNKITRSMTQPAVEETNDNWWDSLIQDDPVMAEIQAAVQHKEFFAQQMSLTCDYKTPRPLDPELLALQQRIETNFEVLSALGTNKLMTNPYAYPPRVRMTYEQRKKMLRS